MGDSVRLQRFSAITHPFLQFLLRFRPVLTQQSTERAVGQKPSAGLALRTIIGFVSRIPDSLHLPAAARARLTIATMDCHLRPKGSYFFREFAALCGRGSAWGRDSCIFAQP